MSEKSLKMMGIDIKYEAVGNGTPLVFIHGMAVDSSIWRYQLSYFAPNYRIIAIDLPGYGKSDKPHDIVYSMDFFARAVHAVVEHESIENPVLIGHSMGYAVLRRYLLLYMGKVKAICNIDGFYFRYMMQAEAYKIWSTTKNILQWHDAPDPIQSGKEFIEYTFYGHTPEKIREEIRAKTAQADPYVVMSSWSQMINPLIWLKCCFLSPALILYCRAPHTRADQKLYFQSCFPKMRYVEWDDAGHYPMLEQPDRFNQELQSFLKAID